MSKSKLRVARDRAGVTQEDVARVAGLSVAHYARIERGDSQPKMSTKRKIAAALSVSVERVFERVEV